MLPLSVGQETLWTLYRLAPDSPAYNDVTAVAFSPAPDVAGLRGALHDLLVRHDLLRSRFSDGSWGAGRQIADAGLAELEVRDIPSDGTGDVRTALWSDVRSIGVQPLDLGCGPLRAVLLRRPADAVLVLVCHHIAGDATSQRIIWRDLLEYYQCRTSGGSPGLVPLRGTYADFVDRERDLLRSAQGAKLAGYWRGQCAGAEPAQLPASAVRPRIPNSGGDTVRRRLDDQLTAGVLQAARARGVTPFSLMIGAFGGLLRRYTAEGDLLIGCPMTLRQTLATRDLVGFLVNTVPLRFASDPGSALGDLALEAAARLSAAMRHVRYPFALMDAGQRRPPALRVYITMVGSRSDPFFALTDSGDWMDYAGHRTAVLDLPRLEGQADLTVEIRQSSAGFTVSFRYDAELFAATLIGQLADNYLTFLHRSVTAPGAAAGRIPLTGGIREEAQLLAFGNG